MDEATLGVVGTCSEHPDRVGAPCLRCGTFRCPECLTSSGLCPTCVRGAGVHAPLPEETVGFSRRALARVLDMLAKQLSGLLGGVLAGIVLGVLQVMGSVAPGWAQRLNPGMLANFAFGLLAALASDGLSVVVCGATPGKALLGLRVVEDHGGRVGPISAVVRELAFYVDGLFFGAVGYAAMNGSRLQQRYGDQWAHTIVVQAGSLNPPVKASAGRLALGLGLGFLVHALILAAAFVFSGLR
jgi:uncharacterized RDD family membrane protein YckC